MNDPFPTENPEYERRIAELPDNRLIFEALAMLLACVNVLNSGVPIISQPCISLMNECSNRARKL